MNKVPFRDQPAFRSAVLGVVLLGIYIYYIFWGGGLQQNFIGIALDLVFLALLYEACHFFYSQFILPTHSLEERRKIADRLRMHAAGRHGPAIFVKNGRKVERTGESDKTGPGLLWIDTASAVVTRTFATFKQVLGPGVHFIEANEKIASVISLHTQSHSLGPASGDDPFAKLKEGATEEERRRFEEVSARCIVVRARTRDGHVIFPTVSVTFRIDAKPAVPGERGSRFGFNADAAERAARGEGVNPGSTEDKRRVPWNQLPGLMAADLWREYLGKFTLNELFEVGQRALRGAPQPEIPPSTLAPAPTPVGIHSNYPSRLLRSLNNTLETRLNTLMPPEQPASEGELSPAPAAGALDTDVPTQTALQTINQMINARLSQRVIVSLDDCGRPTGGFQESGEYRTLTERGIIVLGASVGGLRLDPEAERQLLDSWSSSWLLNAREDQRRIERLTTTYADKGKTQALRQHVLELSKWINKDRPLTAQAAIRTLLEGSEAEIRASERLQNLSRSTVEQLQDVQKWLEEG